MKKQILITCFSFASVLANAQLKVWTGGNTYFGGTTTTPLSLLSVGGAGYSNWPLYVYTPVTTSSQGVIYATMPTPTAAGNFYGITGSVPCSTTTSANTYGVTGNSAGSSTGGGYAIGVYGYAKNGYNGLTYGVVGYIDGTSNGAGVVGTTNTWGMPSITTGKYAGYFYGEVFTTPASPQKPTTGSWTGYSDKRLKKNISSFKDGLEVLRKVNPITYGHL